MKFFKRRNSDPNPLLDGLSTLSDNEGYLTSSSQNSSAERTGEATKTSKLFTNLDNCSLHWKISLR